jgi:thymidylate synthase
MKYGKKVYPHGSEIKEIVHAHLTIEPKEIIYSFPGVREFDKIWSYASQECAWYLSGDRSPDFIQEKAKLWSKITNPDGSLNSQYGYLVFYHKTPHPSMGDVTMTPFDWALDCLKKDKDSRQAVITFNNGGYNFINNFDYICTQHMSFLIRGNRLRCFIALRSSDSIWGLPYNYIFWSLVHQNLFLHLKKVYPRLVLGNIEIDIYSSHIYAKHYDLVESMLAVKPEVLSMKLLEEIPLGLDLNYYLTFFPTMVKCEHRR